ncbi:hypothetical protein BDW68DRAFT_153688 [Aspergillus falconensis]
MGSGSIIWNFNGSIGYYEGELDSTNTIPHGYGRIDYSGGRLKHYRYEGGFELGEKNGQGKLTGPGYEHEGTFVNDLPEHHGVRNYIDGRIYDGWWKAGLREGTGKQTWTRTDWVYSGEWKSDKISGKGTWHSETRGETYWSDNWTDAKINGVGHARYRDGSRYEGKFVGRYKEDDDGFLIYANGEDKYHGAFKNDLFHGRGTLTKGGYKYKGTFHKGKKTGNFTVTDLATGKSKTRKY